MSVDFGGLKLDDPSGGGGGGGTVVQVVSANQSADISTTSVPPIYATLLTAPAVVLAAAGRLRIFFYASWSHNRVGFNVAANFRFLDNAVLLPASRGTTGNELASRIVSSSFCRVISVVAGVHVVRVDWAGFGLAAGAVIQIRPASLPDLEGAQLIVEELTP